MSGRWRERRLARAATSLVATALVAGGVTACAGESPAVLVGASADRGHALILHYGCGACHTIGGVEGADAKVGPELENYSEYRFIVGILPRTPQNTALWVEHPRKYLPQGDMPELGITPAQARDIAAYLYGQ